MNNVYIVYHMCCSLLLKQGVRKDGMHLPGGSTIVDKAVVQNALNEQGCLGAIKIARKATWRGAVAWCRMEVQSVIVDSSMEEIFSSLAFMAEALAMLKFLEWAKRKN